MQRDRSKAIIGVVLVLIGAGLLIWTLAGRNAEAPSGNTENQSQSQQTSEEESGSESEESAETANIIFTSEGFNPNTLTVKKGAVVTVKNESSNRVQFSSDDHPTHLENQGMNLPVLNSGESDSFTADEVGEWGFHDHIDDSKTGRITVTE